MELESLKYPLGRFEAPVVMDAALRTAFIGHIENLPHELAAQVSGLSDSQLDTPYREGGWTVRQLVHHVADSHLNSYIRFRWALTEDNPNIKAYEEQLWAELSDAKAFPIAPSLMMLQGLHQRWIALLQSMTETDFARKLRHPVSGEQDLNRMVALYSWHGRHHTTHISRLKQRLGW